MRVLLDAVSAETVMMETYCGRPGCWFSPHVHVDASLLLASPAVAVSVIVDEKKD